MKKFLSIITGMVASSALFALPVLNPAAPALETSGAFFDDDCSCWSLRVGYLGDFVYSKHVKDREGFQWDLSRFANSGVITLNFWDRLDIYGTVGAGNYDVATRGFGDIEDNVSGVHVVGASRTSTEWGIGARGVIWEWGWGPACGTTYLGLDVQYHRGNNQNLSWLQTSDTATLLDFNNPGFGWRTQEWQVALGISHKIGFVVPYIAVKWSGLQGNLIGGNGEPVEIVMFDFFAINDTDVFDFSKLSSRNRFGWVVGATIVDLGRLAITGEARFGDERAASVCADFRF